MAFSHNARRKDDWETCKFLALDQFEDVALFWLRISFTYLDVLKLLTGPYQFNNNFLRVVRQVGAFEDRAEASWAEQRSYFEAVK